MKKLLNAFLLLGLASCVNQPTAARYEDALSAWIGQSEEALYSEWGYPNTTYSVGPDSFIATYIQINSAKRYFPFKRGNSFKIIIVLFSFVFLST